MEESKFEFYGDFKGEVIWETKLPNDIYTTISILEGENNRLFAACGDGFLRVINKNTGEQITEIYYGDFLCGSAIGKFNCNGLNKAYLFISTSKEQRIHQIDLENYNIRKSVVAYNDYNNSMSEFTLKVSRSNRLIATNVYTGGDRPLIIFETDELKRVFQLGTDTSEVYYAAMERDISGRLHMGHKYDAIEFSADSNFVFVSERNVISLWDISSSSLVKKFTLPDYCYSFCLAVNESKGLIASGGHGTMYVSDIDSGNIVHSFVEPFYSVSNPYIYDIKFSNNGKYLLISFEKEIRVYDTEKFNVVATFGTCYSFSPDQCFLIEKDDSAIYTVGQKSEVGRVITKWK